MANKQNGKGLAYRVVIPYGMYANKNPISVLMDEGANAIPELRKAYKLLKEKLSEVQEQSKQHTMQQIMDGISEAVKLFQNGELQGSEESELSAEDDSYFVSNDDEIPWDGEVAGDVSGYGRKSYAEKKENARSPYECASFHHGKKTLALEAHLTAWDDKKTYPTPLMLYHNKFATFHFIIIDGTSVKAKPNIRDIPGIIAASKRALSGSNGISAAKSNNDEKAANDATDIAYTVKLPCGNDKGLSPAEVLLRDGDKGVDMMQRNADFLAQNLQKYPKNKPAVDAIHQAIELFRAGKLDQSKLNAPVSSAPGGGIVLYETDYHAFKDAKSQDGMQSIWAMTISYNPAMDSPICIRIRAYLGFGFYYDTFAKAYKARPHPKAVAKFKAQMRKLTCRSWGVSNAYKVMKLNQLIRGWINYFKIGSMKGLCARLDSNIRYRLRMCIWKHWKTPQNRAKNLMKLDVPRWAAFKIAYSGARIARMCQNGWIHKAISNKRLAEFGLISMLDYYTVRCVTC